MREPAGKRARREDDASARQHHDAQQHKNKMTQKKMTEERGPKKKDRWKKEGPENRKNVKGAVLNGPPSV